MFECYRERVAMIPSKLHGLLDYVVSGILIIWPWVAGYSIYNASSWTLFIGGLVGVIYSLVTRYEMGVVGLISFRMHLLFDAILGVVILASPWLFRFAK